MSLRTKTLLILAGSILLALAVLTGSSRSLLNSQFSELEKREVQEHVRRVSLAVENVTKQLASKATDWAQWDDTYNFMSDRNEEYLHSNISFETLSAIFVTHVVYRDIEGNLVRGYEVNYEKEEVNDLSEPAMKMLADGPRALAGTTPEAIKSGLILIDGKPYIFAAIPIFDSRRAETCRGSLLFSIALDDKLTETLAEQTRLPIRLLAPEEIKANPSLYNSLLQTDVPTTSVISDDQVKGYEILKDVTDAPIRVVELTLSRDIYQQGQEAIKFLVTALLIVMVVTLLVSGLSLNRCVLSKLKRLEHEVSSIKTTDIGGERVWSEGRDELASLGSTINLFLNELETNTRLLVDARNQAQSANAAKSMFIARVSHELRTPIGGIVGINRIIKKQEELSRGVRNLVEMSDQTANSLLTVIDEILDYSKAESGELTFEKIPFSVRDLIRETMQTISGRLEGKYASSDKDRIGLILDINPNVPSILEGDPTKLKQILINLLGNAVKFTQKGYVSLSIRAEQSLGSDAMVSFEIEDSGIGISPEQLENIFTPYKQADESIHRKYQGTGLGLSIVKQFTEGLGGNVLVRSTDGVGTAFRVTIPFSVISTDDYLIASERNKIKWPSSVVIAAEESKVSQALVKNLASFGLTARTVTPQGISQDRNLINQADLVVVFEDILLNKNCTQAIEDRIKINHGTTIAVASPSLVSLREEWYAKGLMHVLSTPVLVDDLLLLFIGGSTSQSDNQDQSSQMLKFNQKLRVLIADDVSTNRMILEDMLLEAGHEVVSVSDGRELVDKLLPMIKGQPNAEYFDIVLTDISMPILDGDAATREIRQLEKLNSNSKHVPIIAITAHALREEQERIQRSGVDGVLVKPMYPEKVAAEFARLLSASS